MNRLSGFAVLLLAFILYVEAQKQKVERGHAFERRTDPKNKQHDIHLKRIYAKNLLLFHSSVVPRRRFKICSKKEGWDKCEKEKKRNEWEVTCTDTRKSGPGGKGGPGGPGPSGPGGKSGHGGPEPSGPFNKGPGGHH